MRRSPAATQEGMQACRVDEDLVAAVVNLLMAKNGPLPTIPDDQPWYMDVEGEDITETEDDENEVSTSTETSWSQNPGEFGRGRRRQRPRGGARIPRQVSEDSEWGPGEEGEWAPAPHGRFPPSPMPTHAYAAAQGQSGQDSAQIPGTPDSMNWQQDPSQWQTGWNSSAGGPWGPQMGMARQFSAPTQSQQFSALLRGMAWEGESPAAAQWLWRSQHWGSQGGAQGWAGQAQPGQGEAQTSQGPWPSADAWNWRQHPPGPEARSGAGYANHTANVPGPAYPRDDNWRSDQVTAANPSNGGGHTDSTQRRSVEVISMSAALATSAEGGRRSGPSGNIPVMAQAFTPPPKALPGKAPPAKAPPAKAPPPAYVAAKPAVQSTTPQLTGEQADQAELPEHIKETGTTVLVKGLHRRATANTLRASLDGIGLGGKFDLIYVPMDVRRGAEKCVARGIAVINFRSHEAAVQFQDAAPQFRLRGVWARVQGAQDTIQEFYDKVQERDLAAYADPSCRPWRFGEAGVEGQPIPPPPSAGAS
mmetsp:Transcript_125064/g.286565  ORF Transcript_125064/g.286565 Transcript_125064/m.286565 type:complete len:533 (-) Transcript_125064:188-1786(-)